MSANLRFVWNNAADRAATLTASTTSGALAASNMQSDQVAAVWRSTAPLATLTLTWSAQQAIDSVGLFFTNLSPLATVRVRAYANVSDVGTALDETHQPDPPEPLGHFAWGVEPVGRSGAQCIGAPQHAQIWLAQCVAAKKLVLDISDPGSADDYLQVSRICCGARWELETNMDYGMAVQWLDRSKPQRAESGDLRTEYLSRARQLKFNLGWIQSTADRDRLLALAASGLGMPMWCAAWPEQANDRAIEQVYALWGAFTAQPALSLARFSNWAADLTIEEMGQ